MALNGILEFILLPYISISAKISEIQKLVGATLLFYGLKGVNINIRFVPQFSTQEL